MKFLHKPFSAKAKDVIVINFNKPTRVLLIHSRQFEKYKKCKTFTYRGGQSTNSPVEFEVPFDGTWHAVIEKGSYLAPLQIVGNARLIKAGYKTLNGREQNETHQNLVEYDDTFE